MVAFHIIRKDFSITKAQKLENTNIILAFFRVFVISCFRDYFFLLVPCLYQLCDRGCSMGGQRKRKDRTFTGRAFGPDAAMMKIDNALGDG